MNGDQVHAAVLEKGAIGREMAAMEPNWRRPDSFRLPNGKLIGPGCARSPGTDVSPSNRGGVRVSASLASGHLTASCGGFRHPC